MSDTTPIIWKEMSSGYLYRHVKSNIVYQHREVLREHIGEGPHNCHHCNTPISWSTRNNRSPEGWKGVLVVDHLDHDRQNNDISNLVASCQSCNMSRRMAYIHRTKRLRAEAEGKELPLDT